MRRETLIDFFSDFAELSEEFLVYDDGYRSWSYTYRDVARAARAFSGRLAAAGIRKGDKVLFWSENRPEWIVALWGCLKSGVIAVPIDFRASATLISRIQKIVQPRILLAGEEVPLSDLSGAPETWRLAELDWHSDLVAGEVEIGRDDLAEIIFTSGATADPKGVLITHRNLLANIVPVEREVHKYRPWGRPFFPLRFLNLLPLSHMFGQAMATFIPPMLPGEVIFLRTYHPSEVVRQVRERRVSVLVAVPKLLEVLRDHIVNLFPEYAQMSDAGGHWIRHWWRYRRVHRLFGWKFWSFIVGAAPLAPDVEEFWSKLGFLVIQGYGLTETAPIVTLNHPFHARKGTVGTPIAGVELRIAEDGEILVRGENVTAGYYGLEGENETAFVTGPGGERWLRTGDIGEVDSEGRLLVRGRKKEMIVTPDGLNVFPEDVERVLNQVRGVRDSAVVGKDRVHAVLVLEAGASPEDVVRQANERLEEHQRVHGYSVWPGGELPRTEGTRKLKRQEIQKWVFEGAPVVAARTSTKVESVLARLAGNRAVMPSTTLEELGLSSLERVELMVALDLDETQVSSSSTVDDLMHAPPAPPEHTISFPAWSRGWAARALRRLILGVAALPLTRLFAWLRVEGREHVQRLAGPVIFASNHQSYMDTPVILAALPRRRRYRLAPAMSKEFFDAHFHPKRHTPGERFTRSFEYYLAALAFNAFPLPQRESGAGQALRYAGELVSEGWSILIFPEGAHTDQGELQPFHPGVGMLAARLKAPLVPVRIDGLYRVLHRTWKMARPGRVRVRFGEPMLLAGEDYLSLAKQVERAIREMA